ncbi:MAG TPA: hypothetical protein PK022_03090, partial [Syntrophales bacterium]|nr:hypothetical protein [Syntrophales bacterium]
MDLSGQNIFIIGLGKTGLATARFLAGKHAGITVADRKTQDEIESALTELRNAGISIDIVPYDATSLHHIDMVIPSPGVP